ncbi:hypothetical protein ACI2KC_14575 [Pseudomonas monteilii]|uniref:hypothetical protein n=1 Tax=Pseudomonas alabamensis TaxID=3064349 RepID=UPI000745EFB6|nr:hypothetical protein [Pseudomonas entomophila]AMA45201.1 hypothetical protein APT63_05895 [Pseudomonas monteilii]
MTPFLITLLVVAGIALLIVIGYLNNLVENTRLDRARLKIDLNERQRRCGDISETFPGQFMSPALKLLLARIELDLNQRLLALDKRDVRLKTRIAELEQLVALGEKIPVNNPPSPIGSEAKAKDIRVLLEVLHHQVVRATHENVLTREEGKYWVKQIQHILVLLHIEFFNNLGQQCLVKGEPGQARLAFERGVQYLSKQPEPAVYKEQLTYLEKLLARANAQALDQLEPTEDEDNQLTQGLKTDEDENWKKRALYD